MLQLALLLVHFLDRLVARRRRRVGVAATLQRMLLHHHGLETETMHFGVREEREREMKLNVRESVCV